LPQIDRQIKVGLEVYVQAFFASSHAQGQAGLVIATPSILILGKKIPKSNIPFDKPNL